MDFLQTAHPNLYLAFELLGLLSFLAILGREVYQKNEFRVYEILSCLVFGMILEIGNTYLAHTYYYSPNFLITIFNVPLAIGLWWAIIVYCVMLLSDQYNLPWTLRPVMDALTALILDLSFDPVAIRVGFWHWIIPLNQEWFGVPYENLVGWVLVVLVFSFLIRFLRTLNVRRRLTQVLLALSPVLAYLGLMLCLTLFSFLTTLPYVINNWSVWLKFNYRPDFSVLYNPQVQQWKLIVLVVLVTEMVRAALAAMVKYRKKYTGHFDLLSFGILTGMHLFIITIIFTSGVYLELPFLIYLSCLMFAVHLLLHFLPHAFERPNLVYFFKRLEKRLNHGERQVEKFVDANLK